jgi:two-component system OmpR family response regulator
MVKVLLAEDDLTMISLLNTLLTMEGFQVAAAQPEADIPTAIRLDKPDVLLLDVHLGDQNGLEIIDTIRGDVEMKGIRVVMTSGMSLKDECLRHGADEFLLKPYTPDELIQLLKTDSS